MEIEIPTTVLFQEMMKQLGLPSPMYEARLSKEGKLVASITFYPSAPRYHYSNGTATLEGHPMDTLDAANNDAAKQAIKYMERHENKVLKDYNYEKLIEKKRFEDSHISKIVENNRRTSNIIREKDELIKKTRKCWDSLITGAENTNDKITNIAKAGYADGTSQLDNDINVTLSEIETGTEYLTQLIFESTDQLQQLSKYTSNTDDESSEADQFPGYYPTPPDSPMQDTDNSYEDTSLLSKYALCAMDHLSL